jgi:hypothetical protein
LEEKPKKGSKRERKRKKITYSKPKKQPIRRTFSGTKKT